MKISKLISAISSSLPRWSLFRKKNSQNTPYHIARLVGKKELRLKKNTAIRFNFSFFQFKSLVDRIQVLLNRTRTPVAKAVPIAKKGKDDPYYRLDALSELFQAKKIKAIESEIQSVKTVLEANKTHQKLAFLLTYKTQNKAVFLKSDTQGKPAKLLPNLKPTYHSYLAEVPEKTSGNLSEHYLPFSHQEVMLNQCKTTYFDHAKEPIKKSILYFNHLASSYTILKQRLTTELCPAIAELHHHLDQLIKALEHGSPDNETTHSHTLHKSILTLRFVLEESDNASIMSRLWSKHTTPPVLKQLKKQVKLVMKAKKRVDKASRALKQSYCFKDFNFFLKQIESQLQPFSNEKCNDQALTIYQRWQALNLLTHSLFHDFSELDAISNRIAPAKGPFSKRLLNYLSQMMQFNTRKA